ncbi:MAG TPA: FKBP-type peptidyl-prolyl cis-trans isomerase [Nitrospirota bacterium]
MKKQLAVIVCLALAASAAFAADKQELKTSKDKLSYALGHDLGRNLKRSGIETDTDVFMKGLKDALSGGKSLMTDEEAKNTIAEMEKEWVKNFAEKNKKEGEAFLAENKKKSGVKTLPSGLQYKVITEGKGKSPQESDTVTVNYRGTLIDGTEFDSSYKRGQPATFPVNGVIKGWTEALQHMKEGAKWQLFIPADLAYGERAPQGIPPNAALVFEVELISIQKK